MNQFMQMLSVLTPGKPPFSDDFFGGVLGGMKISVDFNVDDADKYEAIVKSLGGILIAKEVWDDGNVLICDENTTAKRLKSARNIHIQPIYTKWLTKCLSTNSRVPFDDFYVYVSDQYPQQLDLSGNMIDLENDFMNIFDEETSTADESDEEEGAGAPPPMRRRSSSSSLPCRSSYQSELSRLSEGAGNIPLPNFKPYVPPLIIQSPLASRRSERLIEQDSDAESDDSGESLGDLMAMDPCESIPIFHFDRWPPTAPAEIFDLEEATRHMPAARAQKQRSKSAKNGKTMKLDFGNMHDHKLRKGESYSSRTSDFNSGTSSRRDRVRSSVTDKSAQAKGAKVKAAIAKAAVAKAALAVKKVALLKLHENNRKRADAALESPPREAKAKRQLSDAQKVAQGSNRVKLAENVDNQLLRRPEGSRRVSRDESIAVATPTAVQPGKRKAPQAPTAAPAAAAGPDLSQMPYNLALLYDPYYVKPKRTDVADPTAKEPSKESSGATRSLLDLSTLPHSVASLHDPYYIKPRKGDAAAAAVQPGKRKAPQAPTAAPAAAAGPDLSQMPYNLALLHDPYYVKHGRAALEARSLGSSQPGNKPAPRGAVAKDAKCAYTVYLTGFEDEDYCGEVEKAVEEFNLQNKSLSMNENQRVQRQILSVVSTQCGSQSLGGPVDFVVTYGGASRRTFPMIMALARGTPILTEDFILDSYRAGQLVNKHDPRYRYQRFRHVPVGRPQGSLFRTCGSIYLCHIPTKSDDKYDPALFSEVIGTAGGTVVQRLCDADCVVFRSKAVCKAYLRCITIKASRDKILGLIKSNKAYLSEFFIDSLEMAKTDIITIPNHRKYRISTEDIDWKSKDKIVWNDDRDNEELRAGSSKQLSVLAKVKAPAQPSRSSSRVEDKGASSVAGKRRAAHDTPLGEREGDDTADISLAHRCSKKRRVLSPAAGGGALPAAGTAQPSRDKRLCSESLRGELLAASPSRRSRHNTSLFA